MTIETRCLAAADLPALRVLASLASAEGFRFVQRFVDDIAAGSASLHSRTEFFVGVVDDDRLIGFGGVTPDPYVNHEGVGRLRHLYVRPDRRDEGIGAQLVRVLEQHALAAGYAQLRLRTDTSAAARFYERLGYSIVNDDSATHRRVLKLT
jgi:GNAT superfamily N-acetyltransferase